MNKQLKFFLVLAIPVLCGLLIWRTDYIYTYVIDPTARIFWLFYRTLQSFDQEIYWFILIFSSLSLIFRVLPERKEILSKPAKKIPNQNLDRVLFWDTLIKASETDPYDRLRLQRCLQTLTQSIEVPSSKNEPGIILLPPIKKGLRGWIQRRRNIVPLPQYVQREKTQSVTELEKSLDQILKSMETQMEINHD